MTDRRGRENSVTLSIKMEDTSYLPVSLNAGNAPANMAEIRPLVRFIYNLCMVQQHQMDNTFTIKVLFFQQTREQLDDRINECGIPEAFRPSHDVAGLHKVLRYVISPGFRVTRENADQLAEDMQDGELNTSIRIYARQLNNQINDNSQTFTCFTTVLEYFSRSVSFLLTKAILAASCYKAIHSWISNVGSLEAMVTDMLLSLGSRTEANTEALRLVGLRQGSCDSYRQYLNHHDNGNWNALVAHQRGLTNRNVTFKWNEFVQRFRDRTIWYQHVIPEDTQCTNLLADEEILKYSKRLDVVVEKIRNYSPSQDVANISKKTRVQQRVGQIKTDLESFRSGEQKNVSKAKLLVDSLKFLNGQLERLHVEGIDYTQESIGFSPGDVAANLEELEQYLVDMDQKKKQVELSQKLNSMEFSKHLPGVKIVKLYGTGNYLSWISWYNQMSKMVSNTLTKTTLVKNSLTNKTDQKFLENISDLKEIMEYIKTKYASKDEILYSELQKLYRMKKCGSDMKIMLSNSETFLVSVNLFDLHGMSARIDRITRARVIDKILTTSQLENYMFDVIRAEAIWRAKYEARMEKKPEEDDESLINGSQSPLPVDQDSQRNVSFDLPRQVGSSSTPYVTPTASPTSASQSNPMVELVPPRGTTEHKLTSEQVEAMIEKQKRMHLLRHHRRYYECVRRLLHHHNTFHTERSDDRRGWNKKRSGAKQYEDTFKTEEEQLKCPLCKKTHGAALIWCFAFKKLSVDERLKALQTMFKDACRKCLDVDKNNDNHKGGICRFQVDRNLKCKKCDGPNHHTLLHKQQAQKPAPGKGGAARGGGGGGQGRGKPTGGNKSSTTGQKGGQSGGQFKRQTRKQRIARSEKAYYAEDDDEDCDCDEVQLIHGVRFASHGNQVMMTQSVRKDCKSQVCKAGTKSKDMKTRGKKCTKHHNDWYLACVSKCTVLGHKRQTKQAATLWDTGSSLNFVTHDLCRRMSFPQVDTWKGTMSTIDADRRASFPIHMVKFLNHLGEEVEIPCLATEYIGWKRPIPGKVFADIAKTAKIDVNTLQQVEGQIDVLAGASALDKFPCTVECPGQQALREKLPSVRVMQCRVSGSIFPFGYYTNQVIPWENAQETRMVRLDRIDQYGIFAEKDLLKSSFSQRKNKKNLRISIPQNKEAEQGIKDVTSSVEETQAPNSPLSLTDSAKLSPLLLGSGLSRSQSIPGKGYQKAMNFWQGAAMMPSDNELKKSISQHYDQVRTGLEMNCRTSIPRRVHQCHGCMLCKNRFSALLDTFSVIDYKVSEKNCTLVMQCGEKCEVHRQISSVLQVIRNTTSHTYENMTGGI